MTPVGPQHQGRPPRRPRPRRGPGLLLSVLLALTVLLLLTDLTRPAWTAPLREAAAGAVGPVQATLAGWAGPGAERTELVRERDQLAARVHALERELAELRGHEDIADGVTGRDRELLTARVVGIAPVGAPVAARTVTIDAGREDGVRPHLTVVSAAGLVGRVLRVSDASSDVLLLGDADVVVGVRFGEEGALGMVDARPAPGLPPRDAGELTLTVVGDSAVAEGDEVVTLGSPDGRPYVAGVPLGTVTRVDPDTGQLGRTAVVEPHVDPDTLDLVAVVLGED